MQHHGVDTVERMSERLSYVAITPARNEAERLPGIASCMIDQVLRPQEWIIVDNGSTDETLAVATELAEQHSWITVLEVAGEAVPTRGGPVVRSFHAGLAKLRDPADIVVKLDADVSFDSDYFSVLLEGFSRDPSLGIAGGTSLERAPDGSWAPSRLTANHVRGSVRAYRWACLQQVTPLEERMGWDGIDELKAQVRGWRTRTLVDLSYYHYRVMGAREHGWLKWSRQGDMAHFMGYRVSYLLARTAYHMRREPNAAAMLWGFALATLRRKPRCSEKAAIAQLRQQQSLHAMPTRVREKLGLTV